MGKIGCFAFKFASGEYNSGGTRIEYHVSVDCATNISTCFSLIKTRINRLIVKNEYWDLA